MNRPAAGSGVIARGLTGVGEGREGHDGENNIEEALWAGSDYPLTIVRCR
jgi:hypothetical protein